MSVDGGGGGSREGYCVEYYWSSKKQQHCLQEQFSQPLGRDTSASRTGPPGKGSYMYDISQIYLEPGTVLAPTGGSVQPGKI
jgi:hypothetical protein